MKKLFSAIVVLSLAGAAGAQSVEVGAGVGFKGVPYVEGTVHAPSAIGGMGLRGDVSYNQMSKENAVYKLSGSNVMLGAGVTYPIVKDPRGLDAHVHGGVRYSITNIDFSDKVLGKTLASASHNAFGVGAGVQVSYPVARNLRVTGDLGADHYFKAPVTTKVGDYKLTTKDEQNAVAGTVFKARVGVKTSF